MDNILMLIKIALGISALITIFIPNISQHLKIKILSSILIIGILLFFFTSNFYNHLKYFDINNIFMINGQLPHTFREGNKFFHKYLLTLENRYPKEINVKNVILTINSRMPILRYDILLPDISENSLNVIIKNRSELEVITDSMSGGEIFAIEYECSRPLEDNSPEKMASEQPDILKMIEYDLFGQHHSCECWKGLNIPLSETIYEKENILFEKVVALDHRKVPHDLKYEYQHAHYIFDNDEQDIAIFCSPDMHLNILYNSISSSLHYKSIDIIKEKISILRLISFKDGYFLHETTIPIKKIKHSPKKIVAWNSAFQELDQSSQKNYEEPLATRTFWLLREKGAKISLGCPGEKCLYFELGKLEERDGGLWQQIYLSGNGLGIKRDLKKKLVFSMESDMKMRGAHPGIEMKTGRFFASIQLRQGSYFEIFPDIAHIKLWVLDTKSDSLRIKLEVRPM